MFRAFQQKARFCTNLCEEDLLRLRQSTGLLEDETVCLLIDDSLFGNRASVSASCAGIRAMGCMRNFFLSEKIKNQDRIGIFLALYGIRSI